MAAPKTKDIAGKPLKAGESVIPLAAKTPVKITEVSADGKFVTLQLPADQVLKFGKK